MPRGFTRVVTAEADDAALMYRVGSGDQAAFAALFDRHQAAVLRFAFRFVGSQGRAEEVAQEVFLKVYRSAKSYRPTAKFKTWLFRIVTNHCLNENRRGDRRHEVGDEAQASAERQGHSAVRPDESLEGKELERAITAALLHMSERERAAFCMCRFEGMPYRDIADALSASEAAVKSLIHRATLQVSEAIETLATAREHRSEA